MTAPLDPTSLQLGRSAPSPQNPKDLHIARFLRATHELPPQPEQIDHLAQVPDENWAKSMFGNDQYGDCVFASTAHRTMVQSAMSGKLIVPTTAVVLRAYSAVTGFRRNDPSTDQGAIEVDALNWERRHSFSGAKVIAFARVDPHDHELLRRCAFYFGVWFGINLPKTAQGQVGQVWDVTDKSLSGSAAPGSWGGHAVYAAKYDPDQITCVTWTHKQPMTNAFIDAYADEAWVALPSEWQKNDPYQALNWDDLNAAVAQFGPVDPQQ